MPLIHDPNFRKSLHDRADKLTRSSERRWGKMSVDQMVWHITGGLELGLERLTSKGFKPPIPLPLLRFMAQYLPIPKEKAPTIREMEAKGNFDLPTEVARFHEVLEDFAAKPLDASWPAHPVFRELTGKQWSRIQANHADYHLKQFGV